MNRNPPDPADPLEIGEIDDERSPEAASALALLARCFPPQDRQPSDEVAMEIAEKRLGLLTSYDFHMIAALDADRAVRAVSAGVYLGGVNAGFITYLAVDSTYRARGVGRRLRFRLVQAFQSDARAAGWEDLNWVLGEVRSDNPWIERLVRDRGAIPFDLRYFHPGLTPGATDEEWLLYRQPIGDDRRELPADEVRRALYAVWRRAYRVRWPLARDGFTRMLEDIEGRAMIGAHPDYA